MLDDTDRRLLRQMMATTEAGVSALGDRAGLSPAAASRRFDKLRAREAPEAVEIQTFLGRVEVRVSVIARDMGHYQEIYRDRILTLPHITDIEALMQVATVKSDEALPI